MKLTFRVVLLLGSAAPSASAEPWATYRGNPQRTGSTDGKAGPAAPKVLWAMKSKDHFIAVAGAVQGPPVRLRPGLHQHARSSTASTRRPKAEKRVALDEAVAVPEAADGQLAGRRRRQAHLRRRHAPDQRGVAVLPRPEQRAARCGSCKVEGDLVHLEGSPTVAGGKVYLGGGAAGVLCVDPSKLTLDGKEMTAGRHRQGASRRSGPSCRRSTRRRRRRSDSSPCRRPSDDLPQGGPGVVWQKGKDKWHVDAPVAVVDGKVLAASAFLDKEKVGERALFCLDAKTGKELWKAPLTINPWGGPSVQGDVIVVVAAARSATTPRR